MSLAFQISVASTSHIVPKVLLHNINLQIGLEKFMLLFIDIKSYVIVTANISEKICSIDVMIDKLIFRTTLIS